PDAEEDDSLHHSLLTRGRGKSRGSKLRFQNNFFKSTVSLWPLTTSHCRARSDDGQRLFTVSQNRFEWSGMARCTTSCVTMYCSTNSGAIIRRQLNERFPSAEQF